MAKLRTASTYLQVYNLILEDAIVDIIHKDDIEFQEELPALVVRTSPQLILTIFHFNTLLC